MKFSQLLTTAKVESKLQKELFVGMIFTLLANNSWSGGEAAAMEILCLMSLKSITNTQIIKYTLSRPI
mgnify:CR=1 FL=1